MGSNNTIYLFNCNAQATSLKFYSWLPPCFTDLDAAYSPLSVDRADTRAMQLYRSHTDVRGQ